MSAHVFRFDKKTKAVQQRRKEQADQKRMVRLLNGLNQEGLERCLFGITSPLMQAECLKMWTPYLRFTPHDDTLGRVHDAQRLRVKEVVEARTVDVIACADCSRVANKPVQHPAGVCPPGAVLARAAVDHADLDVLVLVPPGQIAKETPVEDEPNYPTERLPDRMAVVDDDETASQQERTEDENGAGLVEDSNHDVMTPYRADERDTE